MITPRATYRIQFRDGVDFAAAADLAPYLQRLDISHLYASPIYAAVAGSTHGYDVVDHNVIDPSLGGRAGFERMVEALRRAGIGVLLDIVPNHMAASMENPWWRSVVRLGAESPYAHHFDIDWSRRLTLPILGGTFEDALANGEVALKVEQDGIAMAIPGADLPIAPRSYWMIFSGTGDEGLIEALGRRELTPEEMERLEQRLRHRSQAPDFLRALHEAQPWRLMNWKEARRDLSYRRFFEVTGLVGVAVDDPQVFADVHGLTLELVRDGLVDGLRVDHVDGLSDPARYLADLRAAVGPETWIVVEKILGPGEDLPPWNVAGTTGYEFISSLADVFVDADGLRRINEAYADWIGRGSDAQSELRNAKLQLLHSNFEGELGRLARLLGRRDCEEAIAELIAGFDVYRTYGGSNVLDPADRKRLDDATRRATARRPDLVEGITAAATALHGSNDGQRNLVEYRRRFQQLSGPVMAKALEDTFFYRHHAFVALNEVGSEPDATPGGTEAFHRAMLHRLETQPLGLTATATHDTKRGEDARARLYTLSHAPAAWLDGLARWRKMTAPDGVDAATEWLIYQALAGIWPTTGIAGDAGALRGLRDRFLPFLEKALREAKLKTDWLDQDHVYEDAAKTFACALLDPGNSAFQHEFGATIQDYAHAGERLSRAQLALKLFAPGIPDIYQGTEREDFSLVDPDNRRVPDFSWLRSQFETSPTRKQALISDALAIRRDMDEAFRDGRYIPLDVQSPWSDTVVAFARAHRSGWVVLAAASRPFEVDRLRHSAPLSVRLPAEAPRAAGGTNDAWHCDGEGLLIDARTLVEDGYVIAVLREAA